MDGGWLAGRGDLQSSLEVRSCWDWKWEKLSCSRQGSLQSGSAGFRGTLWSLGEEENVHLGAS